MLFVSQHKIKSTGAANSQLYLLHMVTIIYISVSELFCYPTMMLLSLFCILAAVSVAPASGRRVYISTDGCDRWVEVTEDECPMAYSLAFSGGIESPYYNICK